MFGKQEDSCFKINKGKIAYRIINSEAVILNLDNGIYYSLNKTGALIWQLIEKGNDLEEISGHLAEKFDAKEEVVKKDIKALIVDLAKENLIEKISK